MEASSTIQKSENIKSRPLMLDSSNAQFAVIAMVASLIVGGIGCYVAYADAKVVGGDAYNYVIGAGRGIAIVGFALIIAQLGVVNALFYLGKYIAFNIHHK